MGNIEELLIAAMPALTAILSVVGTAIAILTKFKQLIKQVKATTDVKSLETKLDKTQQQLDVLLAQNIELKKNLNQVLESQDHIKR